MEKALSQLTREEWIKNNWIDVTQMGDSERMMLQGMQRTPDEMYNAMMEWDMMEWEETAEFREVKE
jgi:hypothetical protein